MPNTTRKDVQVKIEKAKAKADARLSLAEDNFFKEAAANISNEGVYFEKVDIRINLDDKDAGNDMLEK